MNTDFNIFAIQHNDVLPTRGGVLIAEPFMKDAYFQRGVVLLAEHNNDGSMGFVLNKKTNFILNDFFPELEQVEKIPVFLGGPVGSNRLFFIHTLGEKVLPGAVQLTKELYFDGNFERLLEYIVANGSPEGKIKFFLGYSGWTPGQLKNEIKENFWLASRNIPAEPILQADNELFWKEALGQLGSKYKTWAKFPKDPDLN